jgi:hypothetical protein
MPVLLPLLSSLLIKDILTVASLAHSIAGVPAVVNLPAVASVPNVAGVPAVPLLWWRPYYCHPSCCCWLPAVAGFLLLLALLLLASLLLLTSLLSLASLLLLALLLINDVLTIACLAPTIGIGLSEI